MDGMQKENTRDNMLKIGNRYASIRFRKNIYGSISVFYDCKILNIVDNLITIEANNEDRYEGNELIPFYKTNNSKKTRFSTTVEIDGKAELRTVNDNGVSKFY